jgi:hypothetical protein
MPHEAFLLGGDVDSKDRYVSILIINKEEQQSRDGN